MQTGLVLEGGGMRGIYTVGVLDVFMENDLWFDGVVGVSAGAIHGCAFVSRQHGRNIGYMTRYCRDKRFMSFYSLLTTGDMVGVKFGYEDIPERLSPFDYDAFAASNTKFYVVCTNLETGGPEYFLCDDLRGKLDYIRASASMPYVSRFVQLEGKKLLDGGSSDSIPLAAAQRLGYGKNVVVRTREAGFLHGSDEKKLLNYKYRKYPNFLNTIRHRPELYARQLEEIWAAEGAGDAFVIQPSKKPEVGRVERDPNKLRALYDLGRADTLRCLPELKQFLQDARQAKERRK